MRTYLERRARKKGFTLVELLVAVAILAILTAALLPRIMPFSNAARIASTSKELRNLNTVIEAWEVIEGEYPEPSLDLENPNSIASVMQDHGINWTGDETGIVDSWGNPYYYQSLGGGLYCIISAGPDGVLGTDDDLYIDNFSNLSQGIPPIGMNEIIVPSSSNNANPGGDGPGPEHQAEVPDGHIGIRTPAELASIGVDEDYPLDGNYIVMKDLDLSGYSNWNPIGNYGADSESKFTGTFNGNNYVISNLKISRPDTNHQGLFGRADGGKIENLGLENVDITGRYRIGGLVGYNNNGTLTNCYATGNITGDSNTGGLVGQNNGTITDCYATGKVTGDYGTGGLVGESDGTITDCYATGSVSGNNDRIGGLVGRNYGALTNCYATGEVTGGSNTGGLVGQNHSTITDCYATGMVIGGSNTGGLVGYNNGAIENCYTTGKVSSSGNCIGGLVGQNYGSITNCYATGEVTGNNNTGGLVGYAHSSSITNCYATGEVTGDSYTGGLVGYTYSSSITNCYATGKVTGGSDTGGLVGYNNNGTITNCYYNSETTGRSDDDGRGSPLTTAEMKNSANFTDWDFIITWSIEENNSYPYLQTNEQIPHPGIN
jgi:prepilin-type N-terminal cleavage/methylation domain-containing protein